MFEAEKPLDCTNCHKAVEVYYTVIEGSRLVRSKMCAACPLLQKKLRCEEHIGLRYEGGNTELSCPNCGTVAEDIVTRKGLGCSKCYQIFDDKIIELISTSGSCLLEHVGRKPEERLLFSPALRLVQLNEILEETLDNENFEQAAWIRDQIIKLKASLINDGD
ncbi:MAG: UvrB/UvrC motif-containing protein [Chlamydiota bacterium]